MEAFGRPLDLSWNAFGAKMASRSDAIIDGEQLFFRFDQFATQIQIFTNLGRFGEGFGKVLGVFGEDFWRIWLRFLGSLGKRITCVGEWLITSI